MNNFKPYSDRTKYRKIAAQVAQFVEEAQGTDDGDLGSTSSLLVLPSETSVEQCNCETVLDITETPIDAASLINSSANCMLQSNVSTAAGEIAETADWCSDRLGDLRSVASASCYAALHDDLFIEPDEWKPRAIDADSDDSDDDNHVTLGDQLATWVCKHNISHAAVTDLLNILHLSHPDLPRAAKTLLRTKRNVETKIVAGGEYFYFGLHHWLEWLFDCGEYTVDHLTIHVNIDGIPLFNSSLACLWPILCSIREFKGAVFPVAIYCSSQKPKSVDEYLHDFIEEVRYLKEFGFNHNGKVYTVSLGAVICDAPARAFVKCVKGHSGYNCCERCVQHGEWLHGKVLLPDLDAPVRTNSNFMSMSDEGHHVGISPFTQLDCGMVTDFPLDYMHLICLGAVRRLILQWVSGHHCYRLSQALLSAISDRLVSVHPFIPREFSRKPRSLAEHKLWKATELRLFLIYTGPVILKGLLAEEVYSNFVDLSVAVRILLSPDLLEHYAEYCNQLMRYFVESFCSLYGKDQMVYTVHSLVHLCDDAKHFGALDNVSAFQYESFLGRLVKLVRRPQQPCVQIVHRLMEWPEFATVSVKPARSQYTTFAKPHMEGPVTMSLKHCQQYKQYSGLQYFMSTSEGDNCFEVVGKIGLVRNILKEKQSESQNAHVVFEEFTVVEPLFSDPLDSRDICIYFVSKLACIRNVYPLTAVMSKYILLPHKHGFAALKQMHQC